MPTNASGEIKIRIVHNTQKNGDVYVFERQTVYDPDKKYNKVLGSKLLFKIPKGSGIPVATRPKKPKIGNKPETNGEITATRDRIGMMEIIDHIGTVSGIDEVLPPRQNGKKPTELPDQNKTDIMT